MNENLKRIEDAAADYASSQADFKDEDWSYQFDRDYNKKFAELIIEECLDACADGLNTQWLIYPTTERVIADCKRLIKERFA